MARRFLLSPRWRISSPTPFTSSPWKRYMYTKFAEIPVPTGAQFLGSQAIQLSFSVRDHERNIKRQIVKDIFIASSGEELAVPPQEVSYVAQCHSPSGRSRVVLRDVKDSSGKKRLVETWTNGALTSNIDVSGMHGAFYADEYLSSLAFSPDETIVVYTAERLVETDEDQSYSKFRYRPDLGEGLAGKRRPATFLVHLTGASPTISRVVNPEHLYLGQCIFSPSSNSTLFATAYELQPDWRLLGVKGCYNRPSGIWKMQFALGDNPPPAELKCTLEKLTPPHLSCRSPRIVSKQLVWLAEASSGAHVSTSALHSLDIEKYTIETNVLVAVVDHPQPDGFPGLYPPTNLANSPVLSVNSETPTHIAVHSYIGSRTCVILISLDGERTILDPGEEYSWSVLATDGKSRLICSRSTSAIPYEIVVGDISDIQNVSWRVVDRPTLALDVETALGTIQTKIIKIPEREPTETVVIQSTLNDGVSPCVLVPHGGPHGTVTTAFNPATTALVLEGYTLSLPNYTGSPGFGDASINALIGECGRRDVDDCIASLEHLIKLGIAQDGPGRLFVMGGSHGGFLTAHLIGQFPDKFTAASMRNPVISGGDTSGTDIPDWYYSEFGFAYPIQSSPSSSSATSTAMVSTQGPSDVNVPPLLTSAAYKQLQAASPISYVDVIKTPVLLLIGLADRRVAPTQGIEFYHALKARFEDKKQVDMLVFEGESHPLDGVEAAKVCYEAARDWFAKAKESAGK